MDAWDLIRLLVRRWYFAAPALLLAITATVLTATSVRPTYVCTVYVQLLPPVAAASPAVPSTAAPLDERNPWLVLGLSGLAETASVSLTDGVFTDSLAAQGFSRSFTQTVNGAGLLRLKVLGTSETQAATTADQLITHYLEAVRDLQAIGGVAPADLVVAKQVFGTSRNNVQPSTTTVKRAVIVVAAVGLLLTLMWTVGVDAVLRSRRRRRLAVAAPAPGGTAVQAVLTTSPRHPAEAGLPQGETIILPLRNIPGAEK